VTRDRVENAIRRVHSDELANTTVDVYEPAESYTQGEGWSVTYPDTASASYKARVDSPSAESERERSGTTSEIDVVVRVRDDTGQTWTGFGENTEAPVRVEDTNDGTRYEVENVIDDHDGMITLEAVEV
jgi:hypothetical protein